MDTFNQWVLATSKKNVFDSSDQEQAFLFFPDLVLAASEPQSPVYHAEGDVWTHTTMVINSLLSDSEYKCLCNQQEKEVLFLAALLHDISKAFTRQINPQTGEIGHPGHSKKGELLVRHLLWMLDYPHEKRELVCNLIQFHQLPFFAISRSAPKDVNFWARLISFKTTNKLLVILARADIKGRICGDSEEVLESIELYKQACLDENCLTSERQFVSDFCRVKYFDSQNCHPDYEPGVHENPFTVYVMCGLPASGKDTYVRDNFAEIPALSIDDSVKELGLSFNESIGKAVHLTVDKAKDLLRQKKSFVWNATNTNYLNRKKTLDLIHGYGAVSHVIYLESSSKETFSRNTKRDTTLPNKKLLEMSKKWEVPSLDECFKLTRLIF